MKAPPVEKIIERIIAWFEKHRPEVIEGLNPNGATEEEIQYFEEKVGCKLPEAFKAFYKHHNGWKNSPFRYIRDFQSLGKILETTDTLEDFPEYDHLIPFTISHSERDFFAIDLNNPESVVFFSVEDDE